MSAVPRSAAAPTYGWLLGMSAWLILPLIGPGFGWVGFLITGTVARRTAVIVTGVVFAVLGVSLGIELWGELDDLVNSVIHLAGIVAGLAVNPGWLRTMWARRGESARPQASVAVAPARPATQPKRQSRAERAAAKRRRSRAAAQDADAQRLAADLGAHSSDLLRAVDPAEPVDVQTASADDLQSLPGMTRMRARRAVKERTKRNGFLSLEDFGEVAGLQPHEIVRLRAAATCSPRPRGERRFGRRVDY